MIKHVFSRNVINFIGSSHLLTAVYKNMLFWKENVLIWLPVAIPPWLVTGLTSCCCMCLQVPGSMLKQMPPPSGSVGGVGGLGGMAGLGGGVFPPQLSPQHIAMLSSIYPPHIQFQLVSSTTGFHHFLLDCCSL